MSGIAPSTKRHQDPDPDPDSPVAPTASPTASSLPAGRGRRADNAAGDAAVSKPRTAESRPKGVNLAASEASVVPRCGPRTTASTGGVASPHDSSHDPPDASGKKASASAAACARAAAPIPAAAATVTAALIAASRESADV